MCAWEGIFNILSNLRGVSYLTTEQLPVSRPSLVFSYFLRLLGKVGASSDEVKKLRVLLLAKAKMLPKQEPAPDSVAPDSALTRLIKAADALRKKNGDSHIAMDHIVAAAVAEAQLAKVFAESGINASALSLAITEARGSKKVTSENAEKTFDAL